MENSLLKTPKKFGMVIDLDRCTGCCTCMVACMSENNIPFKEDESNKLKSITWMRVYKLSNGQPFPNTEMSYIPRPCMHCEGKEEGYPPCVSVCPATATDYDSATGIVSQIYPRCFGCRYCMAGCPYHARYFNWADPVWPEGMTQFLNPDVSPRMRGVVEKCTFCFHRYQAAKERAYHEGRREIGEEEYQPACAQACPSGAIIFGDLNNPRHRVFQLVNSTSKLEDTSKKSFVFRLLEKAGTNPKVYYRSARPWIRMSMDNHLSGEDKAFKLLAGKKLGITI